MVLDRYIAKTVVLGCLLACVLMLSIFAFVDFIVEELASLMEKYKDDLAIVGCNIEAIRPDESEADATARFSKFVSSHPDMSWIQLHAAGGVEKSELAHQMGIATEPSFFLVGKAGKLVESNMGIRGLDREIERERRR